MRRPKHTYNQPIKGQARRALLEHAVSALTHTRHRSTLLRARNLRTAIRYSAEYMVAHGFARKKLTNLDSQLERYLVHHRQRLGRRRPSDLRVLYLCGPEPANDLDVLLSLGCQPHNIWALERDGDLYTAAIDQLRRLGVFIHVYHGSLHSFFSQVGGQFDIVYIDGCSPLPGGQPNAVTTLMSLFANDRLSDVAALVTNFAEYSMERSTEYVRLMTHYFRARYNETPQVLWEAGYDPAIAQSDFEYARSFVASQATATYSDFVTRLVCDMARTLVPWAKIGANADVARRLFVKDAATLASDRARKGFAHEYPLLAFLDDATGDDATMRIADPIAQFVVNGKTLGGACRPAALLEGAYAQNIDLASPILLSALRKGWVDSTTQYFCDGPTPILMFSMLAGVYGRPHFVNPERSKRLRYVAKATPMYSDVFILDRCASFFDIAPSVELLPEFLDSPCRQLLLRGCIDQIGWHDFASATRPFKYSALGGMGEHRAAYARDFEPRVALECD